MPPFTFYSIIKEKDFQPTSTTIFDESLHSNVEVNNVSNFIDYYVGHNGDLLASEEFYHLLTSHKKFKKRWLQEFSDKKSLVLNLCIVKKEK